MKVLIAGGGTTGHLSPGIAVADELRRREAEVLFVGSASGPEARIVPAAGYAFHPVRVSGRGRGVVSARNLLALGRLAVATVRCAGLIRRERPDAVLGTGGYVSLPAVLAGRARGLPVVLHEQNRVPGMANRVASRWAARIGVSFPGTEARLGPSAVLVGNPVRSALHHFDRAALRARALEEFRLGGDRPTLLVFGGSQGAQSINKAIIGAYDLWRSSGMQVLHLCGPANVAAVQSALSGRRKDGDAVLHRVVGYTDSMELAYACADLTVCRSGASTVAELAAVGVPAVLVPLPISLDDDQRRNAEAVVEVGGGRLLLDSDLKPKVLVEVVQMLFADRAGLETMAASIRSLHRPDAAAQLANLVEEVVTR